jgi:triosephosphate isomerase
MIVALNNKSNLDKNAYKDYLERLNKVETDFELILCPTHLNIANTELVKAKLGAENVSSRKDGAYTGEVSASQLKSYDVEYTIVGHSERREYQKETFEDINEKVKRLFEENITPILCIGESKEQRENTDFKAFLEEEITTALAGLTEEQKSKVIIAYEPIWSIGTGIIPTEEQIIDVFDFIKEKLPTTKVLYGGSANVNNIEMLNKIKQIDGYLLGGLSLKPEELQTFLDIMKQ